MNQNFSNHVEVPAYVLIKSLAHFSNHVKVPASVLIKNLAHCKFPERNVYTD